MLLRITPKARARIGAFGSNAYPLEVFGLLLGTAESQEASALAVASLPVGKTRHWYQAGGRFDRIDQATTLARTAFAPIGLQPIGLFCTCSGAGSTSQPSIEDMAPKSPGLAWLLRQPLDGGERIWQPTIRRLSAGKWMAGTLEADRIPRRDKTRNPRRLHRIWMQAWGALAYGNCHEIELARLGHWDMLDAIQQSCARKQSDAKP